VLITSLPAGDQMYINKITCKPAEINLSVGATGQFLHPEDGNKISPKHRQHNLHIHPRMGSKLLLLQLHIYV
jgi:hypothetical protein